jgi:hypothetical protein
MGMFQIYLMFFFPKFCRKHQQTNQVYHLILKKIKWALYFENLWIKKYLKHWKSSFQ